MCYYLDNIRRYVYEDKIEVSRDVAAKRKKYASVPYHASLELISSLSSTSSRSSSGLLSDDSKAYLDGLISNILVDAQARKTLNHAHIHVVQKEAKAIEEKILAEIAVVKGVLDHFQGYTLMFNYGENYNALAPSSADLP